MDRIPKWARVTIAGVITVVGVGLLFWKYHQPASLDNSQTSNIKLVNSNGTAIMNLTGRITSKDNNKIEYIDSANKQHEILFGKDITVVIDLAK